MIPDFTPFSLPPSVEIMNCYCTGRKNGEPYCPCLMRYKRVFKRDGRWIEPEQDLGKVVDNLGGKSNGD